MLVVLFHARFISGGFIGVDIFYVISGYLITGLLLREIEKTGTVSFIKFFARRIKRLLPSSFFVLICTAIASFLILPSAARANLGRDVIAGALYISNYLFAFWQNDYQNLGATPSPIIHFWSLAVEEQFYLIWPFLLVAAYKFGGRRALFRIIAVITFISFCYSLYLTTHSPIWSFYILPTRAWELGIGALILWHPVKRHFLRAFGYLFVLALLGSSLLYSSGTAFPGWAATIPVLACAGIIRYANSLPKGISVPLSNRYIQWLGAVSYPAYLWHWPILVLAPQWLNHPLSIVQRVTGVLLTLLLADLTHRFIEQPLRFVKTAPRVIFSFAFMITLISVSLGSAIAISSPKVIASGLDLSTITQKPAIYADGCQLDKNQLKSGPCLYGDPQGKRTIVLFGDSHAAQWFPTLDLIAKSHKWKLVVLTKSSCPATSVSLPDIGAFRNTQCAIWRENSFLRIASLKPYAVLTSNFGHYAPPAAERNDTNWWRKGYILTMDRLKGLVSASGFAISIDDTPLPTQDIPSCLTSDRPELCFALPTKNVVFISQTSHINPTPWLCDRGTCPAIRNGIVVYRDTTHLSVGYAVYLVPDMTNALKSLGVL